MIFSVYDILMSIRFALWILCIEYTGENPSHLIIVCSRWESSLLQPTWQYNLPSQYQKCYIIFLYRIHSPRTECAIAVFHRHATIITHMLSFEKYLESIWRDLGMQEREKERERARGKNISDFFLYVFLSCYRWTICDWVMWLSLWIAGPACNDVFTGANNSFALSFRIPL